jgi:ParB/RepB/Spo0J family partition protein
MKTDTAPTDNSAPNMAPDKKAWLAEIHTPEAEYNANVPLDLIERDPANREPKPEAIVALAQAIESEGLLQPVVLRALEGGKYRLIAGEHRTRAFHYLKRSTIAARIYKSESDLSAARKALLENSAREGLTPIERARRFKQLEELGMKQKAIGELAGGLSQPVIANSMRLLELPADVQARVDDGTLSEAHGVSLVRFAKWPRACACIARMALDHDVSSKELNAQGLPFAGQLQGEGLLLKIQTKPQYYSDGPIYELPRHLKSHRDFIVADHCAYYFTPENPADNVWEPFRLEQDAARAEEERKAEAREAAKVAKSGGLTAEQKERRAVLEKNKKTRAENSAALAAALEKLTRTPAPTALLVAILCEAAVAGGFSHKRISAAAEMLGITLPKGVLNEYHTQGLRSVEAMRGMDVMDLTRLALAVLLTKQTDDANKNASALPGNVEMVMNSKVPAATEAAPNVDKLLEQVPAKAKTKKAKKSGRVVIDDQIRSEVRGLVEAGRTGAEIAKQVGISLPSVQNIKKALGFVRARKGGK